MNKRRPLRPRTPNHTIKVGFEDMGIQTDRFLEEITDEVIEKEAFTQTDQIYDMPIIQTFCPIKFGLDVETQASFIIIITVFSS